MDFYEIAIFILVFIILLTVERIEIKLKSIKKTLREQEKEMKNLKRKKDLKAMLKESKFQSAWVIKCFVFAIDNKGNSSFMKLRDGGGFNYLTEPPKLFFENNEEKELTDNDFITLGEMILGVKK